VQLLARVSAEAPPVCPCPCPLSNTRSLYAPSGMGPFFERSFDILRRPSALAAYASHACRRFFFFFFFLQVELPFDSNFGRISAAFQDRRLCITVPRLKAGTPPPLAAELLSTLSPEQREAFGAHPEAVMEMLAQRMAEEGMGVAGMGVAGVGEEGRVGALSPERREAFGAHPEVVMELLAQKIAEGMGVAGMGEEGGVEVGVSGGVCEERVLEVEDEQEGEEEPRIVEIETPQ